jgi:hypothetical protein
LTSSHDVDGQPVNLTREAFRWPLHGGMARREFEQFVWAVGGTVESPRRTGEILYRHRLMQQPARANARKKDATRHDLTWGRELQRRLSDERRHRPAA